MGLGVQVSKDTRPDEEYNVPLIPSTGGNYTVRNRVERAVFIDYINDVWSGKITREKAAKEIGWSTPTFTKWMNKLLFEQILPPDYLFSD